MGGWVGRVGGEGEEEGGGKERKRGWEGEEEKG